MIFIRNVPELTLRKDLIAFVTPALKALLSPSGKVVKAEILVLLDARTKQMEYHGLVTVDSEKAGRRALKKLNGKRLNGRLVMVREFAIRSWRNDRRLNHVCVADAMGKGFRRNDRRRGKDLEVVKDISGMFSSDEGFSRKAF